MSRKIILLFAASGVLYMNVSVCLASPSVYECVIKTEYRLDDNGQITQVPKDSATSLGDRFRVDRKTGRIIGSGTDNKIAKDIRVIQQGDANRIFAAISRYAGGTTDYLQVNEFVSAPEKPFLLVFKGFWIHGGTCR